MNDKPTVTWRPEDALEGIQDAIEDYQEKAKMMAWANHHEEAGRLLKMATILDEAVKSCRYEIQELQKYVESRKEGTP